MNRVLLKGWFGKDNIGDDLLLLEAVKSLPTNWQIYVDGDIKKFIEFKKFTNFNVLENIGRNVDKPETVIYHGGGIFPSLLMSYGTAVTIIKDVLFSHNLYFIGIGISPKKGLKNILYYLLFNKAKLVSVRDDVSKNYLTKLGIKKVVNSGDLIWMNQDSGNLRTSLLPPKTILVCLAQPFSIENLKDPYIKDRYDIFLNEVKKVVCYLQLKGFFLSFVPFLKEDDQFLIEQLTSELKINSYGILKVGKDYQLDNINSLFQQAELAFCMRFHSKLLSIKNQVPFVGICYDYKSECLLEECGISEVGVRYGIRSDACFGEESEVNADKLISNFEYVLQNIDVLKLKMKHFAERKVQESSEKYAEMIDLINK
jgi:polysaccharide pyruvyl transferase WcaK-like protein